MSIKEIPMYAIQCDEPGCGFETADLGGDFSGWTDEGQAQGDWECSDQQTITDSTGTTRHYCDTHRKPVCDCCAIQVPSVDDDGYCVLCAKRIAPLATPTTKEGRS